MSGEGLLDLARRYVALSEELESGRGEIAREVLNGGGGKPEVRPTLAERPGVKGSRHPNVLKATAAEEKILELLKGKPLRASEVALALDAKQSTTSERLRRLRRRGLAAPGSSGAWAVTG
jgi:Bacterial regulatory protein, arsR family